MTAAVTTITPTLSPRGSEIYDGLTVLLAPGQVAELRCPKTKKRTQRGYFDSLEKMASASAELSGTIPAVYFTLNPIQPDLLSRAANRLEPWAEITTTDAEIVSRRWLPLDFDPKRPSGISSNDAEHAAALAKAQDCTAWLTSLGWPAPLTGDSGNGAHLLYRIELPNDEPSRLLVEHVLAALSQKFTDAQTVVDTKVGNAARIWKVYGTKACKGDSSPERPHRDSKLLEIPAEIQPVTREQLEQVAALVLDSTPKKPAGKVQGSPLDVAAWLAKHSIAVSSTGPCGDGTKWELVDCPLNPEHKKKAYVVQHASGIVTAKCQHKSCPVDWKQLREMYEPAPAWGDQLQRTKSGELKATQENAGLLLRHDPAWQGVLTLNTFSLFIETANPAPWGLSKAGSPWTDYDTTMALCWLQRNGIFLTSSKTVREIVQTIARENPYHPVQRYLSTLIWDGKKRIDSWLHDCLGAENSPVNSVIGAKWMIQAVARIMRPGCQADATLLLVGRQGFGKSSALRTLASDEWFTDHLSDLGSKDSRIELHGRWIVEMSEFTSRRSELERKSFLTATHDCFRAPYEAVAKQVPRCNVFAATSNDDSPLTDATGGRRYWSVTCGVTRNRADTEKLKQDRDQLWAEAYARFLDGVSWHDDSPAFADALATEQESRYAGGPFDDVILPWLKNPKSRVYDSYRDRMALRFDSEPGRVTINDCLLHAVGKTQHEITQRDRLIARDCLIHANWREDKRSRTATGTTARFYVKKGASDAIHD